MDHFPYSYVELAVGIVCKIFGWNPCRTHYLHRGAPPRVPRNLRPHPRGSCQPSTLRSRPAPQDQCETTQLLNNWKSEFSHQTWDYPQTNASYGFSGITLKTTLFWKIFGGHSLAARSLARSHRRFAWPVVGRPPRTPEISKPTLFGTWL